MHTIPPLRDDDPDRMLTTDDVASLCGVARRTVEDWRTRRAIGPPPTYLSRQTIRYRLGDVLAWLDARRRD